MAEIDIMFSHIDQNISGLDFPEENFVFTEDFKALLHSYRLTGSTTEPTERTDSA